MLASLHISPLSRMHRSWYVAEVDGGSEVCYGSASAVATCAQTVRIDGINCMHTILLSCTYGLTSSGIAAIIASVVSACLDIPCNLNALETFYGSVKQC